MRARRYKISARLGRPWGGVKAEAVGAMAAIKQEQAQEELALTRAKRMKVQQELAKASGELILMSDTQRAGNELCVSFRDGIYVIPDLPIRRP
jgi:hypothetical protein